MLKDVTTVDGFFKALENWTSEITEWEVSEIIIDDVSLWLEENENRDWTFEIDWEPVDGIFKVTFSEPELD